MLRNSERDEGAAGRLGKLHTALGEKKVAADYIIPTAFFDRFPHSRHNPT